MNINLKISICLVSIIKELMDKTITFKNGETIGANDP